MQGRPPLLNAACLEDLETYIRGVLDRDVDYVLQYYLDGMWQILKRHRQDGAFEQACRDPAKYFRRLIRKEGIAPREVTTVGGKEVSNEERLTFTVDHFHRLAYLVRKYRLTRKDVFNFDETAVRCHEDATGKVLARQGQKRVVGQKVEGSADHRLCCTFIPPWSTGQLCGREV